MKIGIFGIAAVFLAMVLKKDKAEFSILISIAAGLVIFLYALAQVQVVMEFLSKLWSNLPMEHGFFIQLIKILGISYAADFAASICKDADYQAIAGQIELFARLSILAMCIPGMTYLVTVLEGFL